MSDQVIFDLWQEMHPGLVDRPCISRGTGAQPLCYRESAAFLSAAGFNPYSALTFASGVMVFRAQNRAQEGHPTSNPAGLRTRGNSPTPFELADAFMPWADFKREWEKDFGDEGSPDGQQTPLRRSQAEARAGRHGRSGRARPGGVRAFRRPRTHRPGPRAVNREELLGRVWPGGPPAAFNPRSRLRADRMTTTTYVNCPHVTTPEDADCLVVIFGTDEPRLNACTACADAYLAKMFR
jgi:hypothetical protein